MNNLRTLSLALVAFAILPSRLGAQPQHVEHAFQAILDANNAATAGIARYTSNQRTQTSVTADGVVHKSEWFALDILLPAAQRPLIDNFYAAVEADGDVCTRYERQDAHSAHTWDYHVSLPGKSVKIGTDAETNLLLGGFIDAAATPTAYHYYILTWKPTPDGKNITGRLHHYKIDAETKHPNILQPSRPSYAALTDAVHAFAEENSQLTVSRSLHWSRLAATGRWINMYSTWGFRAPLSEESRLLTPLYKAFEAERPHAYRYLNKPAGEKAENVSIIVGPDNANFGLGSQTDWNILYAYFTDEDFPENRYVYALWYKADVPRQQIVGELFVINTERPNGGIIRNPFIQSTVPAYLWQMGATPTTASQLTAYEATIRPLPSLVTRDNDVIELPTLSDDTINAELRMMHNILSRKQVLYRTNGKDAGYDASEDVKKRGLDLNTLENEANAQALGFAVNKHLYLQDLQLYSDAYNETTRTLKENFESNWAVIKREQLNDINDEAKLNSYRSALSELSSSYTTSLQRASANYTATLDTLRRQYGEALSFFTADGRPGLFFQKVQKQIIDAYRSDGSLTDAYVAAKLRELAIFAASMENADEQRTLRRHLVLLRSNSSGTMADEALSDAIVRLGGEHTTAGVRTAKDFDRRFNRDYSSAKKALRRFSRNPMDNYYNLGVYLRLLSAVCQDSAPLASNPADYVQRLSELRSQILAASLRVYVDNGIIVNYLSMIDRAIEALSPSTAYLTEPTTLK